MSRGMVAEVDPVGGTAALPRRAAPPAPGAATRPAAASPVAAPAGSRIAIIADDFTGAADAAVPFADRGAEASVVFGWPPGPDAQVVALVGDTRWRTGADAGARVREMVGLARAWGAERLFVKVDSTLRGNVRAEVGAALAAWGGAAGNAAAVGTPAFPAQGRVVRNGVLHVRGEAVPGSVAEYFPPGVLVADADTDQELDRIARVVAARGAVAVGSAGLARAIAALHHPAPAARRRPAAPVSGVLVVVGSRHPVSRRQAAVLEAAGAVPVVAGGSAGLAVTGGVDALRDGRNVVVTTPAADEMALDTASAAVLANGLGRVVAGMLAAAPGAGLVMTGGATAHGIAAALGTTEFRLLAEVEPGIAMGEMRAPGRCISTITKSGGFGSEDALLRAVQTLEAGR